MAPKIWRLGVLGVLFLSTCTSPSDAQDAGELNFDDFEDDDMAGFGGMEGLGGGMPGMEGLGAEDLSAEEEVVVESLPTVPYSRPTTRGLLFAELFEKDWSDRWIKSENPKFTGEWLHGVRAKEAIIGDYGLKVGNEAKHHAISARFTKIPAKSAQPLVVSYEAKFENDLNCGGAYLKLFDSTGMDLEDFTNETPYVIMFGPDRCGATNKVHLIIKNKNPISGEWVEHHLRTPPRVPYEPTTHLYTVHIKPDNTYEVLVDNVVVNSGSMAEDFEPPFTPPKEIDDPEDKKPEDWVDEAKISDPTATKPDDWDEDAPAMIADPNAEIPEGWLEDEPLKIPDPAASKPEGWNEEEDGDWEAPLISNPLCTVGCGPWSPPSIPNPEYKGKWSAPLIDNPDYKGPWAPRKISNPNYFEAENPSRLDAAVDAVGFELWTMQSGILFDNIVVSQDFEATQKFIDETFAVRVAIEKSHEKQPKPSADESIKWTDKLFAFVYMMALEKPIVGGAIVCGGVFLLILTVLRMCKSSAPVTGKKSAETEKKKKKAQKTSEEEDEGKESEEKSEAEEDSQEENTKPSKTTATTSAREKTTTPRKRGNRPTAAD